MSDTNNTMCTNHNLTTQNCIDEIHFRCSQAKSLANALASNPDIEGTTHLTKALTELLEASLKNLMALQRIVWECEK